MTLYVNWQEKIKQNSEARKARKLGIALETFGYQTYYVGGFVRDSLLNMPTYDVDLATKARPNQIRKVLQKRFPNIKINYVGASFGVIIADGIEIATFRGDRYSGGGDDKNVAIDYKDCIEDDLARRDLTFNAMAIRVLTYDLIDPFGGRIDLNKRVIRFVGVPDFRINEDHNRMIRAVRFAARFGFRFDEDSYEAIAQQKSKIQKIKKERIRLEIIKAMKDPNPSEFWELLDVFDMLDFIIPEMSESSGHTGGKHHTESVWTHAMITGDCLPANDPILRLAGYLHDIGKPQAYRENDDGSFSQHELFSREIIEKRLKELTFSNDEIKRVAGLARVHMSMLKDVSPKARRKLVCRLSENSADWRDLVRLRIADTKANLGKSDESISDIKAMIRTFTQKEPVVIDVKSLAVSGGELIEKFNLVHGPFISKLQKHLFEFFLESGVNDKEVLLEEAQSFIIEEFKDFSEWLVINNLKSEEDIS